MNRRAPEPPWSRRAPEAPAVDPSGIYAAIPSDPRRSVDVREIVARLVDGSRFHEFKPLYGDTLVCGFAHLEGWPIAIIANNGILFSESALNGAHFIELAAQRRPSSLLRGGHIRLAHGDGRHGTRRNLATYPRTLLAVGLRGRPGGHRYLTRRHPSRTKSTAGRKHARATP